MLEKSVVLDALGRNTAQVVPEINAAHVVPETSLADLGANSVDRAEIIALTMSELNVFVPATELYSGQPIGELADLFQQYS